ncbi:unnamed protein product [Caenorhabditis sp. 36 PRJEB53466]|nr:unnamed protein product [Caenorhabditis sp. 36 PRJEB53466]
MAQQVGDGFGHLGELEDNHYAFVQDGRLTLVGRKYVEQSTHNWGHRVAFAGTYVLTFDKERHNWERHDFAQLVGDENAEETLFVREDKLYLLIFANFGSVHFKSLFRWENNQFVELSLTAPSVKSLEEQHRTQVIAAGGVTNKGETILVVTEDSAAIPIYSLTFDGNKALIELKSNIPEDSNPLRGQTVLADVLGNKVLISYGVHGCGFRWENSRVFIFDLETKTVRSIQVEGDYSELPKYCFSGPNVSAANQKSWIVAAGTVQQGMYGSSHYGAVWVLKGVFDENETPTWVEQSETVPEGIHVLDGLDLYTLSKESVTKIELKSI